MRETYRDLSILITKDESKVLKKMQNHHVYQLLTHT